MPKDEKTNGEKRANIIKEQIEEWKEEGIFQSKMELTFFMQNLLNNIEELGERWELLG